MPCGNGGGDWPDPPMKPVGPTHQPIPRIAYVLLVVLAVFWGGNWPVLKIAVRELPVFWFRLVCVWGSMAGLFAIAAASGLPLGLPRGERGRLLLVALFSIVGWNVFSGFGVLLLPAGRASMIGYTMPLWLVLLSAWVLHEKLTRRNLAGLGMGLLGIALLIGEDLASLSRAPVGTLCMLGAATTWAIGITLVKARPFSMPPTVQTAWMMAAGGLPLAVLAAFYGGLEVPAMSAAAFWSVVYNVLIAGVLCYWAFYKLVGLVPASVTAISSLSVPVVGVLLSMAMLGEIPSFLDWVALALIVGALGVVLLLPNLPSRARA